MAERPTPARAWAVVAVVAAIWVFLSLVSAASLVRSAKWFEAVLAIGFARAAYWFAAGAWLRTPWGHPEPTDPLPVPPSLTEAYLRRYLLAAGLAAVALVLALALQALDGRWVE